MTDIARTSGTHWRLLGWCTLLAALLFPAIAMQFSQEVAWGPGDFFVMGILLGAVGFGIEAAVRLSNAMRVRLLVAGAILAAFLLVWAELAVGLFD